MVNIRKINTLCKGKFLELKEVFYRYKNQEKRWEVCSSMNSVSILIYNKDRESIILVKQFRLPVYLKNSDGFTYELCAGLCDKNLCNTEIAREEVLEECGYDVKSERLKKITSTWSSVGSNAAKQDIFYLEVTNKDKVNEGGGLDDEDIEIIEIKKDKIEKFIFDENNISTPGLKFALIWWMHYKL